MSLEGLASSTVVFPLMPQGVEHSIYIGVDPGPEEVVFPLMPQGVEHEAGSWTLEVGGICGFSVDAARR